jgi:hypothetical protein
VVEHSKRVDGIKGAVGKRQQLRISAREPRRELLQCEAAARQFQVSCGQIYGIHLRACSRELSVIRAEARANLEHATAPKTVESDLVFEPGRVDRVAISFHPPEESWAAGLEISSRLCSTGISVPLPLGLQLVLRLTIILELTPDSVNSPAMLRIPLIVSAGSGIVITNSGDREHPVGAKRR